MSDSQCAPSARCFEGTCAPRCDHDSQCASGQTCTSGACAAPLRGPSVCPFEDFDKRPPPVVDDGGSSPSDAGPGGCNEAFEPNDTVEAAVPVAPGLYAGAICPEGDADWFLLELQETAEVLARLSFVHAEGDLELEIVGPLPSLERVAVSQGVSDVEELRQFLSAGRWLVHVFGFGRAQNPYELELRRDGEGEACVDDALEENDSRESATPLSLGEPITAAYCAGSDDWFGVEVPADVRVVAQLVFEPGEELSLELRRPGSGVVGTTLSTPGAVRVRHASEVAGPLDVIVSGSLDVATARPYGLFVRTEPMGCGEDQHESNDSPAEATLVELGPTQTTNRSGRTCAGDLDLFRLSWPESALFLNVTLVGAPSVVGTVLRESDFSSLGTVTPGSTLVLHPQADDLPSGGILFAVTGEAGAAGYTASFSSPAGD